MMKHLMIKVACIFALCLPALSFAFELQYFGLSGKPPINNTKKASVCLLEREEKMKAAINQDLKVQMAVKNMSASEIAARYKDQFKAVSKNVICQYIAAKLGVKSLPAIVINYRYVIYGQQNVDLAVQAYQAYLEREYVA